MVYETLSTQSGYIYVLAKSETLTTDELVAKLKEDPNVISVSPNYVYPTPNLPESMPISPLSLLPLSTIRPKIPDDYYYARMWNLEKINAPIAWNVTTGDSRVLVAINDSGIDGTHEDLKKNIDTSFSKSFLSGNSPFTDENGHGSHVAGTIIGIGNNKIGIAGIAWNAKAVISKIILPNGLTLTSLEIASIEHVLKLIKEGQNIVALNCSYGVAASYTPEEAMIPSNFGYPIWFAYKTLGETNKVVIVVGAGNDGIEVGKSHSYPSRNGNYLYNYPASYINVPNMMVVAAMDQTDSGSVWEKVSDSPSGWGATNWSPTLVDIAAPGSDIFSTWRGGQYMGWGGTSQAAPHVTGAVALLASVSQKFGLSLNASNYKRIILESASKEIPMLTLNGNNLGPIASHGTLDVGAAVEMLLKEYVPNYSFTPVDVSWTGGQVPSSIVRESTTLQVTADHSFKDISVTLKTPNGSETVLDCQVSGSLVKMSFTPSIEGTHTLDFVITDTDDVDWETSLAFSVTKKAEKPDDEKPEKPDDEKPEKPVDNGNDGGGGGCSVFGLGILVLFGATSLIKKKNK
jgi:subtilisin family serine protease